MKFLSVTSSVFFSFCLFGCGDDQKMYAGVELSKEWDAQSTCQTARMMAKSNFSASQKNYVYNNKCTVIKLTSALEGRYSNYRPYAATWDNGVSIRVFETYKGLRMMGYSDGGIPFSWNNDHKPIDKTENSYAKDCTDVFINKVSAGTIEVLSVNKYDDLSGASVEIKYIQPDGVHAKGSCLFDRSKMTMASSKVKTDQYSKSIYENL